MGEKVENFDIMNKVTNFPELIDKMSKFMLGEITQEDLNNWSGTLFIRATLPLEEKMQIMIKLISEHEYNGGEVYEITTCELYKNMFFELYLKGYLNVSDILESDMTFENYDLLEGFYGPWIESFAGRDIQNFKEMLTQALSLYGYNRLTTVMESVDAKKIEENVKSNQEVIDFLGKNKKLISELQSIADVADPATIDIIHQLQDAVTKEVTNK